MKKLWVGLWFLLQVCSLWSLDIVNGQAQVGSVVGTVTDNNVTANLITGPLSPTVNYTGTGGGYSGGSSVGYNSSNNTYYFGYNQQTIAQTIAINNALQGSGVQVNGVQYGMTYLNGANSYGTLSMSVNVTSNTGSTLQSYTHSFNTQNNNWQQFDQTQTFTNPYTLANLGNVSMAITGKDSRWWAGYYGPQVKDPYLKLTYGSDPKTYYNIPDDGYVPVNLPFTFPFYGRNFTTSYFFSNGVVGFLDPTRTGNGFCCDGVDLTRNPGSPWNFAIYALQTDLIQANSNAKFYTQGNSTYMKYAWENINEYGTSNLNTFSTTIKPTGYIGIQHDSINVQQHNVTTGIAGDLSQGQYSQYYTGAGSAFPYTPGNVITFTGTETNACLINPTSSPTCPGYTAAMCSANSLFDPSCPGYAQAVFTQQCNNNPLSNQQCPGYAAAYLDQQCSINPLYSTTCQGYQTAVNECSANPLSHSYCTNYQTATTQCSINPLYGSYCPGYTTADTECSTNPLSHSYCPAYQTSTTQCTANPLYASYCPGYQTAQTTCSTNPLSNTMCTGYADATTECTTNPLSHSYCPAYQTATTQCSANPLYANYCPGYQFAYNCQQDGLYSNQCPNYAEAYAKKNVLNISSTPTATTPTVVAEATTTTTAGTVSTTGTVATTTEAITTQISSGISDTTVSSVVTTKATSTSTEASPAAAVKLTQPAAASTSSPTSPTAVAAAAETKKEEKKEEKKQETTNASTNNSPNNSDSKPSDSPKTARQELAEKRREAAAKEAVAKGKDLANEMGKASDMEAQKAVQNVVIQAMGFTPGFDTYNKAMLPDSRFYAPKIVYGGQVNVDNKAISRRLMSGSDRTHEEMVESQYNRGN